jgi:hypothetical protein
VASASKKHASIFRKLLLARELGRFLVVGSRERICGGISIAPVACVFLIQETYLTDESEVTEFLPCKQLRSAAHTERIRFWVDLPTPQISPMS